MAASRLLASSGAASPSARQPCRTDAELWAELCALPEHVTGQIIEGELLVVQRNTTRSGRPRRWNQAACRTLKLCS